MNRAFGPYAWAYWIMVSCNVICPQLFWFKFCRTNFWAMMGICVLVNVGMWFERFVIVISSLANDFMPSSWDYYTPTWVDIGTLIGSFGLFFTLFCLFARFLPFVAMAEVKHTMIQDQHYREMYETYGQQEAGGEASAPEHAAVTA